MSSATSAGIRRRGRRRLWLGAAALAAPFALFFSCFRPVQVEVDGEFRGEARANPYLAAERLLGRLGFVTWTEHGALDLPEPGGVVLLLGPEPLPSNHGLEDLLDWVAQGGRLVATPAAAASFDALFDHFGVIAPDPADPEAARPALVEIPPEIVRTRLGEDGEPLEVEVPPGRRLHLADESRREGGRFLFRFDHGRGDVLLLTDGAFLENDAIGRRDHARLVWVLVSITARPAEPAESFPVAVLLVRDTVPSLATLLARHAWPALVAGALLLAAWLRFVGARFGPTRPEPSRDRRRLLEHVEAAGGFLWHQGRAGPLLESTRRAVHARIHRREPAWETLPRTELVRRAAAAADLPPARVASALWGAPSGDAQEFVQSIQTLEAVRRSL